MSTGAEPPEDDPNSRRFQDRDTEPIPRARPGSRPESRADYTSSDDPPIEYSPTSDYEAARDYEAAHGGAEPVHGDYTTDGDDFSSDPYADSMTDGAHARGAAAPQYSGAPPSFSQDEFARLQGGDSVPSVPPGSRMAPLEDEASRHAARYLFPTEKFRGEWKRHWIQLAKEGLIAIFATIAMGYIAGWLTKHNQEQLRTAVVVIWALVVLWCAWKVADWWYDRFILTNKRVMVVSGIFTRNVAMMPLQRVTDMKYVQSLTGRMFGYGHFELESAGQDQALRNIRNLPNPNELYLRIVEEMYEPEAVEARLGRAVTGEDDGT
ncbi:PH domain-containing protein [Dactylosporangium sp. NPDC000244]|uniref:PH domain-containing protein n=1 Tax=Dactylosporangium sp. NPDC000244 TaxID=3154365 RepID=UPI00332750CC